MTKSFRHLIVLSLVIFFSGPVISRAGPPTDQIKATVDNAVALLRDSRDKPVGINERRAQLREILFTRFDSALIGAGALPPSNKNSCNSSPSCSNVNMLAS
jgi:hypothetical protein